MIFNFKDLVNDRTIALLLHTNYVLPEPPKKYGQEAKRIHAIKNFDASKPVSTYCNIEKATHDFAVTFDTTIVDCVNCNRSLAGLKALTEKVRANDNA